MHPKFALGRIAVTENAAMALAEAGQEASGFLARHARGDWGEVSVYEKRENDQGLADGSRLFFLSAYPLKTDQTIWVFTDLQQRQTTVMHPKETWR